MNTQKIVACFLFITQLTFSAHALAHDRLHTPRPFAPNVIVPQRCGIAYMPIPKIHHQPVKITQIEAAVEIRDQIATTILEISLYNPNPTRTEAELLVPVPAHAVVRGLTFQGSGKEPTAEIITSEEARRIYNSLVSKMRDPALLEFAGYNLIRSSVFPVEPRGKQKVRLTYDQVLTAHGDRVDYLLPRTESLDYNVPWKISLRVKSTKPISTIYSPSHHIQIKHKSPNERSVIVPDASNEPGPFHLSYLIQNDDVTASIFTYPDPKIGGGYFLLLAGLPSEIPDLNKKSIKREVTIVIDRSGSMNGEKIEQARQAALQILAGLDDGEAFNIIIYQNTVEMFSKEPLIKNPANEKAARKFIKGIKALGGTNIHDALVEALRQKPAKGMLPIVLFLTDGLPTVGQTSEIAIRSLVKNANPYKRRVFTFGVGMDVNAPPTGKNRR